jgi:probable F420-dependent oxidoreductase
MVIGLSRTPVKLGLMGANTTPHLTGEQAAAIARVAEDIGLESLWAAEHIVIPATYDTVYPYDPSGKIPDAETTDWPDPLVWLAYTAASTQRIKLATGVTVLPLRHPMVMAKQIATLDALSGGRVILGVGVGWLSEEFEALGVPFGDRGRRHDDHLAAMQALWSQDPASIATTYATFDNAISRPRPANSSIPIVISGSSKRAARRAAQVGDGFFPGTTDVDELRALLAVITDECASSGRNRHEVELTVYARDTDADALSTHIDDLTSVGVSRVLLTNQPEHELRSLAAVLANRFELTAV